MDYLGYFNLREEPFSNAPLPRFYYASRQHTDALNRLLFAVRTMKGLALLIGDIGRGKTTLARRLLDQLPEQEFEAAMLVIVHAGITANWLLKRIATQLGVSRPGDDKLELLAQLHERLLQIHEEGRKAVVIIDEAQMLESRELMEEFRGLLNMEVPEHKLISFVFFGLPEIEDHLALDPPLAQRVALRYHLQALGFEDTKAYVQHRLRLAGAEVPLFEEGGLERVHAVTGGVPRLVNVLCDNVLLELYFARRKVADAEIVDRVAENLGLGREGRVVRSAERWMPTAAPAPHADEVREDRPSSGRISPEALAEHVATEPLWDWQEDAAPEAAVVLEEAEGGAREDVATPERAAVEGASVATSSEGDIGDPLEFLHEDTSHAREPVEVETSTLEVVPPSVEVPASVEASAQAAEHAETEPELAAAEAKSAETSATGAASKKTIDLSEIDELLEGLKP